MVGVQAGDSSPLRRLDPLSCHFHSASFLLHPRAKKEMPKWGARPEPRIGPCGPLLGWSVSGQLSWLPPAQKGLRLLGIVDRREREQPD